MSKSHLWKGAHRHFSELLDCDALHFLTHNEVVRSFTAEAGEMSHCGMRQVHQEPAAKGTDDVFSCCCCTASSRLSGIVSNNDNNAAVLGDLKMFSKLQEKSM